MRLLWVVQRYGDEVQGGAESHCRAFAERLAARGHQVEVLTSTAVDYVTWANEYLPGTSQVGGLRVHRLGTEGERGPLFFALDHVTRTDRRPLPVGVQRQWLRAQGPYLPGLEGWLAEHATRFDAVAFMTYLYYPTVAGLAAAAPRVPTVLTPTAHDEPALWQALYDTVFRHPAWLAYNTPEEVELLTRRLGGAPPGTVVGIGVDPPASVPRDTFRVRYALGERPYLLYTGRIDAHKGVPKLQRAFVAYKERNGGPLALVLMGKETVDLPAHPDVVRTGFVDDATRDAAMAGALALVQPSRNESFSMVLTESWALGVPALVEGANPVLAGHARRSGGAIPYQGFAEFEAAVALIEHDARLRRELGEAGRRYVEAHYTWPAVLDRFEGCVDRAMEAWRVRYTGFVATNAKS